MTDARPENYWIAPDALYITLNAMGQPDYLQGNVSSGAVIMCYMRGIDGLSFDAGHNYRRWPLAVAPTYFNTSTPKYVYAAIPKSEAVNAYAQIVYPSEKIDLYGKNEKGEQIGVEGYYFVFLQGIISASVATDGTTQMRSWTQRVDCGSLASDEAIAAGGTDAWWKYSSVDDTVTFLKTIAKAVFDNITAKIATISKLILGGKPLTGVAEYPKTSSDSETDVVTPKYVSDHGEKEYLSKTKDDETTHKLTMGEANVKNDFTVGEFVKSLYAGKGAGIDKNGDAEVESLRVRSSMDVMELIVNRLSAIEGDQLLTESDTIESVTKDDDGTYTLKLKSKWDGYFTAQAENNVLKGIINTLAQGSGEYHTAWFRVNSVNTVNNSINVTMYPDDETPAGKNYEPQALMKIARWGNATDTTRQSCIYLSSTEGRIVKLVNVTKPIIDKTNYGTTWGSLPDFVKSLKDDDGNLLPLRDGLDYLYAPGIVTMDIVRLNRWTNKRLPTYVDRGAFAQGSKYYCEATNPDTGEYETSDVWYYGCKWRCCKNLTSAAPAWNNTDWAMVEGNPEFRVDFAEAEFIVDPDNVNIPLTLVAKLYNIDVTDDIKAEDIAWTRYSEDADGNERTALDNAWSLKHAGSGKSIVLTKDDMDIGAYMPKAIRFTATATLRDGEGNAAAKNSVTYDYE